MMNRALFMDRISAVLGLLAIAPLMVFVGDNLLRYEWGVLPQTEWLPWAMVPALPLILVGGAVLAVSLNTWALLELRIQRSERRLWLMLSFVKRPWNLAVLLLAGLFLSALLAYIVIENSVGIVVA